MSQISKPNLAMPPFGVAVVVQSNRSIWGQMRQNGLTFLLEKVIVCRERAFRLFQEASLRLHC